MSRRRLALLVPLCAALALSLARAQDGAPPPDDPFRDTLEAPDDVAAVRSQSLLLSSLPPMRLRGTLRVQGRAPAALIEVAGAGVHVLRAGDGLLTVIKEGFDVHFDVVQVTDRTIVLRAAGLGTITVR